MWQSPVEIEHYVFHCVFRAHYRVRSAVTQNFRYRHGGHTRWVNVSITYEFTQRILAPPATEVQHYERGNAIAMCNRIMFDFYPGLPHMYLMCTCFWTQMMTGKLIKACPEDAHLHTFVRAMRIVSGDRSYLRRCLVQRLVSQMRDLKWDDTPPHIQWWGCLRPVCLHSIEQIWRWRMWPQQTQW